MFLCCCRRSKVGGTVFPHFFPALLLAFFFARAALSERLEQANSYQAIVLVDPCYLESQLNPLTPTPAKTGCAARMFHVDDALSLTSPTR